MNIISVLSTALSLLNMNLSQVLSGVVIAAIVAGLPFLSSTVREREQAVANMRDASLDAKDEARNARLRTSSK